MCVTILLHQSPKGYTKRVSFLDPKGYPEKTSNPTFFGHQYVCWNLCYAVLLYLLAGYGRIIKLISISNLACNSPSPQHSAITLPFLPHHNSFLCHSFVDSRTLLILSIWGQEFVWATKWKKMLLIWKSILKNAILKTEQRTLLSKIEEIFYLVTTQTL